MKFLALQMAIYLVFTMNTFSQDFSEHKWENRLIILSTDDLNNSLYQQQIDELIKNEKGLLERKIIVYHILPNKYIIGLSNYHKLEKHTVRNIQEEPFKITLIGLDGGVKLSQSEFLTASELFSIIDRMPMRKFEIDNN